MAESKIDFSFENLHFSCEGDKDWVETQLNQVLNRIPGLNKPEKIKSASGKAASEGVLDVGNTVAEVKEKGKRGRKPKVVVEPLVEEPSGDPLFEFLKEKNADKNQVKKFLATAVYLHSQGEEKFSTPMVSKALKASNIEKLINASDCLNKNEKKGFCIKDEKDFILTEAGIRSILGGIEE
ncbi:MAG: hypothetical protein NTY07_10035 [Bacteroidia bacterium]|nr:hypothetical protein [Bacteroidia bacterium]